MLIDVSTLILTAIFIIAIFGPIIYFIWKGKHRLHKTMNVLKKVEKEQSLRITQSESWNDKAIGLDPEAKRLIFVDMLARGQAYKLIDLKKVTHCKVVNTGDVIQLLIDQGKNDKKVIAELNFFNTQNDDPLDKGFLTLLANKWSQLIEMYVVKIDKSPRRAA